MFTSNIIIRYLFKYFSDIHPAEGVWVCLNKELPQRVEGGCVRNNKLRQLVPSLLRGLIKAA